MDVCAKNWLLLAVLFFLFARERNSIAVTRERVSGTHRRDGAIDYNVRTNNDGNSCIVRAFMMSCRDTYDGCLVMLRFARISSGGVHTRRIYLRWSLASRAEIITIVYTIYNHVFHVEWNVAWEIYKNLFYYKGISWDIPRLKRERFPILIHETVKLRCSIPQDKREPFSGAHQRINHTLCSIKSQCYSSSRTHASVHPNFHRCNIDRGRGKRVTSHGHHRRCVRKLVSELAHYDNIDDWGLAAQKPEIRFALTQPVPIDLGGLSAIQLLRVCSCRYVAGAKRGVIS